MMTRSYGVAEVKRHLSELLGRVAYGAESIVITKRGRPIAKIVPLDPAGLRTPPAAEQQASDPLLAIAGCIGAADDPAPADLAAHHDRYLYGDAE